MALALGAAGARLALVGRDAEQLANTANLSQTEGAEAELFRADVTDEGQVTQLEKDVAARFGRVDILINNAGINIRKPLTDFTYEEWTRVLNSNLNSAFLMCRAFVPHMRGKGYGRVINMTSIMSHISLPGRAAYSASKAGLLGLTKALAMELASENVTVVAISPGPFATEMNTVLMKDPEANAQFLSKIPLGQWGQVEDIGALALFLCSDQARFITGTDILIDGGWCAQ